MSSATNVAQTAIERARARLAELKAAKDAELAHQQESITSNRLSTTSLAVKEAHGIWQLDDSKDWNSEQRLAIITGMERKSFCLIGAAGTGKTSTLKGLVLSLLKNSLLPTIPAHAETKWLKTGRPGIALVSFTNMAVRQIAKHFSKDITTVTIHKLLEFAPVIYYVEDPATGEEKKTMRFEPQRNRSNPLPRELKTIVIDESSMVDSALVELLIDALPDPGAVQFILLGDLNQLPPVYGGPILGRALLTLPIVELVQVYRQALESPIISLAIKMKDGLTIPLDGNFEDDRAEHGKLVIKPWSKPISDEDACGKAANFIKGAISAGILDPFRDMCLCPFNVGFGTLELNRSVADWLGRERDAFVHEVIAGFNTTYLAEGDKVLVNKREALITKIQRNPGYSGKRPANPDLFVFDRWGGAKKRTGAAGAAGNAALSASQSWEEQNSDTDVDAILQSLVTSHTEVEDRKQACSHRITVRFLNGTHPSEWGPLDSADTDEDFETAVLDTASAVNEMLFAYVVTVHKSQGSEWRKVFIFLHNKHNVMCSRELLYTAITRAAKELYIICEPDRGVKVGTLTKAAKTPRLKGNSLAEKLVSLKERFKKEAEELLTPAKKKAAEDEGEEPATTVTPLWDARFGAAHE